MFSILTSATASDASSPLPTRLRGRSSTHCRRIPRWRRLRCLRSPARCRRGTAYSIIRRSQITGTAAAAAHAGGRPPKMDAEMRDFCMLLIEELPSITLREINRLMRTTWPNKPVVNEATISRALSGMLISVKLVHDVPVNRNRPDIVQQRKR